MFQGSANVPKNRHFELIEQAGGSLNASTWFDRTNYYETLPSHHLELALWLESDRMGWQSRFQWILQPGREIFLVWNSIASDPYDRFQLEEASARLKVKFTIRF